MTTPVYNQLSPFATTTSLPKLMYPQQGAVNGEVEKLSSDFKKVQWVPSDHPSVWRRDDPDMYFMTSASTHAPYKDENEMLYTVNRQNFRTLDAFDKNNPGLMSLGCSHTYGIGVRDHETWPYAVSRALNLPNWNLGSGGQGVDYCLYVAREFISKGYTPKAIAVWWPHMTRCLIPVSSDIDSDITATILDEHKTTLRPDVYTACSDSNGGVESPMAKMVYKGQMARSELQMSIEFLMKREYLIQLCRIHNIPIVEYYGDNILSESIMPEFIDKRSTYSIPRIPFCDHDSLEMNYYKSTREMNFSWDPALYREKGRDGMHHSGSYLSEIANQFQSIFKQNYDQFV